VPVFTLAAAYLVLINFAAFVAFASDKRRAIRGQSRIRESTLLNLAVFGGTSGALAAQQLLRHKTRKEPFRTRLWLIAGAQALILIAGAYWARNAPAVGP
jgi:uncharacterized membrane protein YsdA (DUF1294 family)